MTPKEFLDEKFASRMVHHCWMCKSDITRLTASVDHLVPKSKGGRNKKENFRLACKPCNENRGNRRLTREEWERANGRQRAKTKNDYSALSAAIKQNNLRNKP